MNRFRIFLFVILLISIQIIHLSSAPETPQDVAAQLEQKLLSLQSFQAHFEQAYYSASVSTPLKEKGILYFKKPDWMRWEYKDPEEKVYLYKEGVLLSYLKEENQLIRRILSEDPAGAEILSLLSGKQKIKDNYLVESSPFPTTAKNVAQIKLTPKKEEENSYILLEVDRKSGFIGKAVLFDWAGNKSEFLFSQVKTNLRFPRELFELKVPDDCEIIEDAEYRKK